MKPEDLVAYLDGELSGQEELAVEAELDARPELVREVAAYCRQRLMLAEHYRSAAVVQVAPARKPAPVMWRISLAAAALFVLAVGASLMIRMSGDHGSATGKMASIGEVASSGGMMLRSGQNIVVQYGMDVRNGDVIHVSDGGGIVLKYCGESTTARMLTRTRACFHVENSIKRIDLDCGEIALDVAMQTAPGLLCVSTPQATATVGGTRFSILSDDISTLIEMLEGCVLLRRKSDGREVTVNGGYIAEIGEGVDPFLRVRSPGARESRVIANETFREKCPVKWRYTSLEREIVKELYFERNGSALRLKPAQLDTWCRAEIPIAARAGYYVATWDVCIEKPMKADSYVTEGFFSPGDENGAVDPQKEKGAPKNKGQDQPSLTYDQWYKWQVECEYGGSNGSYSATYKYMLDGKLNNTYTELAAPSGVFFRIRNLSIRLANFRIQYWPSVASFERATSARR